MSLTTTKTRDCPRAVIGRIHTGIPPGGFSTPRLVKNKARRLGFNVEERARADELIYGARHRPKLSERAVLPPDSTSPPEAPQPHSCAPGGLLGV